MTANSQDLQNLYRELILDHARAPRNFGRLENATHSAEGINPLCGDKLHLYVTVAPDCTVIEAGFEGSGCAISMASASLLTETVADLSIDDVEACISTINSRLSIDKGADVVLSKIDLSKLRALDGVREHPSRIKCATLAWKTLHAALHQQPTTTTE